MIPKLKLRLFHLFTVVVLLLPAFRTVHVRTVLPGGKHLSKCYSAYSTTSSSASLLIDQEENDDSDPDKVCKKLRRSDAFSDFWLCSGNVQLLAFNDLHSPDALAAKTGDLFTIDFPSRFHVFRI